MKHNFSYDSKEDFVVVTMVSNRGSVPQELGAKAFVNERGLIFGTVGGGKLEARAIEYSQFLLADKLSPKCTLKEWNLTRDIGMTCGGVVTLLFELVRQPTWKIVVYGAGHVSQELIPLLSKLDCQVTCLDSRPEWLTKIRKSDNVQTFLAENLPETVKGFQGDEFFVLMTQGHSTDLPILAEILKSFEPPYVGVIGSKTKSLSLKSKLTEMNISHQGRFFCPIGNSFGNSSPIEIAFSVISQLIETRDLLQTGVTKAKDNTVFELEV